MLSSICCIRACELAWREVAVAVVHRLELAAVDGDDALGQQLELPAQRDEATADVADALAVVVAEVGDGLEVGRQAPGQPHDLDVALGLALEATAGLDPVQIAVDVDLEQHGRVVRRSARGRRLGALEPELPEVEFVDEGVDHPDRVVFSDVVVEALREQGDLASVRSLDESLHHASR